MITFLLGRERNVIFLKFVIENELNVLAEYDCVIIIIIIFESLS